MAGTARGSGVRLCSVPHAVLPDRRERQPTYHLVLPSGSVNVSAEEKIGAVVPTLITRTGDSSTQLGDAGELVRVEAGPTDQRSVDIGAGHQLGDGAGLD
jgi:hypothetical protein